MVKLNKRRLNSAKKLKVEKVKMMNEKNTQEFSDLKVNLRKQIAHGEARFRAGYEKIRRLYYQEGRQVPFWIVRSNLQIWDKTRFVAFNKAVLQWARDHQKKERETLEQYMTILIQMHLALAQQTFLRDLISKLTASQSLSYDIITQVHRVLTYVDDQDKAPILVNDTDFHYRPLNNAQYAIGCYRHELRHQLAGVSLTRDNLEYLTAAGAAEDYVNQYLPEDNHNPDDPFSNAKYPSTQNDDEDDHDLDLPF